MNQEILKAITNSLPAMQMEALKIELEKASKYEGLKSELIDCKNMLRLADEKVRALSLLEGDMQKSLSESKALKEKLELDLLKKDLSCAKEVAQNIKELAMAAFRNPTVTKTFNTHAPNGCTGGTETTTQD